MLAHIMKTITQAIKKAEQVLPGKPAPEGRKDPRWQAVIEIGDYIENCPDEVWQFAEKWGRHPSKDLRMAIATCLLEHLLEYHFERIFPLVERASLRSRRFAETFRYCSRFVQTVAPRNKGKLAALEKMIEKQRANKAVHRMRKKAAPPGDLHRRASSTERKQGTFMGLCFPRDFCR